LTTFLVDKSAFEQQRHHAQTDAILRELAAGNSLAVCEVVALELLYSARSPEDYEARWSDLAAFVWLPVDATVTRSALEIQRRLAALGQHRRPIPDLLVAATALVHEATVLHYDRDFDVIAAATGQPTQWIIPRGSGHSQSTGD
jgi:predicted nucleic acid-binding protein